MNYSIVHITESTIPSALIDAYEIRIYNIRFRFSSSDNTEAANPIDIVYGFIVVFESFGGIINIIEALVFRYIINKKIDFEGWNILNSRDLELNDSSVNIVT